MILFTVLLFMLILLIAITVFAIAIGGSVFVILFSDVIVCIFIIAWIIKHLIRKKK